MLKQKSYVSALKKLRNGVFHYQKQPLSRKVYDFLIMKESEIWIMKAHSAFKKFFERELGLKNTLDKLNKYKIFYRLNLQVTQASTSQINIFDRTRKIAYLLAARYNSAILNFNDEVTLFTAC